MVLIRHFGSLFLLFLLAGCGTEPRLSATKAATHVGDEIVVCGQRFHTGAPVVLWTDPGGYNGYSIPAEVDVHTPWQIAPNGATPLHFGIRANTLPAQDAAWVRDHGWTLPLLQQVVDQFVIHYDGSGLSRECFKTLSQYRGLSVHFMLDIDGTIYQTLDLQERAWHATTSNDRSVGIEIANVGAFPPGTPGQPSKIDEWYTKDADGRTRIVIPARLGDGGVRTPGFVGRPVRNEPVVGVVQGKTLRQYDLTREQYDALVKLTATLCRVFPRIRCDYPHDSSGVAVSHKLPDEELAAYQGVLGHYHIQTNKEDPGPAFQWGMVVDGARELAGP